MHVVFLFYSLHCNTVSERLHQIVLFCQFFYLVNTLETRGISEYLRWILLVRSLDLCFRHLNRSGCIFTGVLQQCLSWLGSLFCIFSLNVNVEKLESSLNPFVIAFCWVRILANNSESKHRKM